MCRECAVESISAVYWCASVYVRNRNMGLQGYLKIYMLILLLSAIVVINVQSLPKGDSGENKSGHKHNDSHDSNVSTGDDKNKSNISSNTSHNKSKNDPNNSISDDEDISDTSTNNENGKNDTTTEKDISSNTDHNKSKNDPNSSISDDENISDTSNSISDDDNKSDTSANTNNKNGKNDTITGKDIEHDITIITGCIMRTRIIGTLIMHITQLTKVVFVFLPSLRIPVINYFNNVCAFVINYLIQFNNMLEVIIKLLL